MRSQIVSGASVKLELLELLAIEGVALRSIASGPQALFCSDVGAGSPAWRIGMTTKSPAFGRAIRKHSERDEANTLGQNSHKSLFALSPRKLILSDSQIFGGRLATVAHFFEAHLSTLIETTQSGFFDCRDVHEDILATVVGLNESISLRWVKPLHSTCRH